MLEKLAVGEKKNLPGATEKDGSSSIRGGAPV
jgi:hypothetical protein